jgi:AP endonuclease-2
VVGATASWHAAGRGMAPAPGPIIAFAAHIVYLLGIPISSSSYMRSMLASPSPPPSPPKAAVQTQLGKRPCEARVPACAVHGEPCREWTVRKAGPNRGRQFYLCARPVGPPTDKEARCNHFEWKR